MMNKNFVNVDSYSFGLLCRPQSFAIWIPSRTEGEEDKENEEEKVADDYTPFFIQIIKQFLKV